ncbi:right-handed parallel beta-helix repeat-containing protein [Candidatus Woesearchaeota archaeon]|nr:right-handed parallel beta-helix repeat-containing protein [Candidatus Woesearchaeota archaeon]
MKKETFTTVIVFIVMIVTFLFLGIQLDSPTGLQAAGHVQQKAQEQGTRSASAIRILAACPNSITACCEITSSGEYTLTDNISSTTACIRVEANDVDLDCAGSIITYDTSGTSASGTPNIGINVTGRNNVTIKNCNISDNNALGDDGYAIMFNNTENSTIHNNTIQTNGSNNNHGVFLILSSDNNITNNTINSRGTTSQNIGAYLSDTSLRNLISGNTISTRGTNNNFGIQLELSSNNTNITNNTIQTNGTTTANYGIRIRNSASSNSITNNLIQTNGTSQNFGIILEGSTDNNTVSNNTIQTQGTGNANEGIRLSTTVSENLIDTNSIQTRGTSLNVGIRLQSSANNNTVTNNVIQTNGTTTNNIGILLISTASQNSIINNAIQTKGTINNHGISLSGITNNNTLVNNTIQTNGTSTNVGIRLDNGADNNLVLNNSISTTGSSSGNNGILLTILAGYNNVTNNHITTNGTSSNHGISLLTSVSNNIILNNTISTHGTSSTNIGISLQSTAFGNNITNNKIQTNGTTNNYGIRLESAVENNSFVSNNIRTVGLDSYGISAMNANGSIFNNTVLNDTVEWINTSSNSSQTFTNTTFENLNGSMIISENFTIIGEANVSQNKLNITFNNAFLNSTNLSFMNTSAQITLRNITFDNARPLIDVNDSETFVPCEPPQCVEVSYVNQTFIFNVSSFTAYESGESHFIFTPIDPASASFTIVGSVDGNLSNNSVALVNQTLSFFDSSGDLRIEVEAFFELGDVNLTNFTITETATSFAVNHLGSTNIGKKTIYLQNTLSTGVFVCPNATSVAETTTTCQDIQTWTFSEAQANTTKNGITVSFNGTVYNISNLSNSGVGQSTQASSSAGGGGGSGATRAPILAQQYPVDTTLTQVLDRYDRLTFNVNDEPHQLTIMEITAYSVTIEVRSTPQQFTLRVGDKQLIDVDSDGAFDLFIRIESIHNGKSVIFVRKIAQMLPISSTPQQQVKEQQIPSQNAVISNPSPQATQKTAPLTYPAPALKRPSNTNTEIASNKTLLIIFISLSILALALILYFIYRVHRQKPALPLISFDMSALQYKKGHGSKYKKR